MSTHQMVLALFDDQSTAAAALRELHGLGVSREDLSIVARSHDEEGELAREMDATPGAEIEDSRIAARLGELGGQLLAAIAIVMPGIGPIVVAGPLAADFGEVAGHVVGGIVPMLTRAGVSEPDARAFEQAVEQGAILIGVHARTIRADAVRDTLIKHGGRGVALAFWAN